jgi:hypothetical protein
VRRFPRPCYLVDVEIGTCMESKSGISNTIGMMSDEHSLVTQTTSGI